MQIHWLWFTLLPDMTVQNKLALLEHFSDPEEIYHAEDTAFSKLSYLSPAMKAALENKDLTKAQQILQQCRQKDIGILPFGSSRYPTRLKNIPDPPLVLYYRGVLPDFQEVPIIGVVGTRRATSYGCRIAKAISRQIAQCGALVVSGGASGIDTSAMIGALETGERVVGVLAGGVDTVYPAQNGKLFDEVVKQGCLLSEYAPGVRPQKWTFPRRNRIISGMANGVLVVEAPQDSGALITARQAYQQGRDLFVVPGNIDVASCAGSNALLQERGTAVMCGWDVVKEYAPMYPGKVAKRDLPEVNFRQAMVAQETQFPHDRQMPREENDKKGIDNTTITAYSGIHDILKDLTPEQKQVALCLSDTPVAVDVVIEKVALPAAKVLSVLTVLSLKGIVQNHPGKRVSLRK